MKKPMLMIVLPVIFGITLANAGYGIFSDPYVFWPAALIFVLICILIDSKKDK